MRKYRPGDEHNHSVYLHCGVNVPVLLIYKIVHVKNMIQVWYEDNSMTYLQYDGTCKCSMNCEMYLLTDERPERRIKL